MTTNNQPTIPYNESFYPKINIDGEQYDQNTYMGRVKKVWSKKILFTFISFIKLLIL